MGRILFYPSGDPKAGYGHVTRCSALADELAAGGRETVFACRAGYGPTLEYITGLGQKVLKLDSTGPATNDLTATARLVGDEKFAWLVADTYDIDGAWLASAKSIADKVAVIDDLADRYFDCDVLINQNLGFDEAYEVLVPPATVKLIGPKYALLRRPFIEARADGPQRDGRLARILIFMGGDDGSDYTSQAVRAAAGLEAEVELDVVVGPNYSYVGDLHALLDEISTPATLYHGASAEEMADLMVRADLCIGAAGSTSWERCCLGLPSILLVIADNQRSVGDQLEALGAAISIYPNGESLEVAIAKVLDDLFDDAERLIEMSAKAASLVDGQGTERVALELHK